MHLHSLYIHTWKHKEREILEYFNTSGMILQVHRAFQKSTHFFFGKLSKATLRM
jgi:hypothetical protein